MKTAAAVRPAPNWMLWQVVLGYAVVLSALSPYVFGDLTNALARAHVMADLFWGGGQKFGGMFFLSPALSSYVFSDFVLMLLLKVFPLRVAGSLAVLLMALCMPAAFAFYLEARGSRSGTAREIRDFGFVLALLLGTGWFFVSGFFGYQLGLALVFVALGCWEHALRGRAGFQVWFALSVFLVSLTHLSAFLMLTATVGTLSLLHLALGDGKFKRCLPGLFVLGVALLIFVLWGSPAGFVADAPQHEGLANKFLRAALPLSRFDMPNDLLLFGALGVFIIAGLNIMLRRSLWESAEMFEFLAGGALSLLIYFALPRAQGMNDDLDARALPYAYLFFIAAALYAVVPRFRRQPQLFRSMSLLIPLIAYANLVYLAAELFPKSLRAEALQQQVEALPPGRKLFVVVTETSDGHVQPLLHVGCLYTLLKDGLSPYVFSANFGHAMHYFHYRELPYTPSIFWYIRAGEINWARVRQDYDFVLLTKPISSAVLDAGRLDLSGQVLLSESPVALTLAVQK